jgi:hypothetical protein
MTKGKSFWIGCFHFGIKEEVPFVFKWNDYASKLEIALSKISNLSKLEITTSPDFKNETIEIDEALPELNNGEGFFPYDTELEITFNLYIPFRVQSELTGLLNTNTFSENFKITIIQGYYFPVTIIETINPTEDNNPSTAVWIVREFLENKINNIETNYIKFESIWPSPFHCDFFIEWKINEDENWTLSSKEQFSKGYDSMTIYFNLNKFNNTNEVFDYIKDIIRDEFSFFYKYSQERSQGIHKWNEIEENLKELLWIEKQSYIRKILWNKKNQLIEKLFTDITVFEGNIILQKWLQNKRYMETFSVKEEISFSWFIDKKINQEIDINYPVKQTIELIKFYENRRMKYLELIITIIAAIIGGAIGSLLTTINQTETTNSNTKNKEIIIQETLNPHGNFFSEDKKI